MHNSNQAEIARDSNNLVLDEISPAINRQKRIKTFSRIDPETIEVCPDCEIGPNFWNAKGIRHI